MRRASVAVLSLVVLASFWPPTAAQATVEIERIRILDSDGKELRIAPASDFVQIEVTVNNTGSASIPPPLSLRVAIEKVGGGFQTNQTLTKQESLGAGNTTTFVYSWSAAGRTAGEYRVTAQMTSPPSASALVGTFTVAETAVPAGSLADRVIDYAWSFGLFLAAAILFFVALVARRG